MRKNQCLTGKDSEKEQKDRIQLLGLILTCPRGKGLHQPHILQLNTICDISLVTTILLYNFYRL